MAINRYSSFGLFITGIRTRIRAKRARKQREKEAAKFMPRKAEIVAEAFSVLDQHLRTVSVG